MNAFSTRHLARTSSRHPWIFLGIWVVLLVAGGYLASHLNDVLSPEFAISTKPDSVKADDLLEDKLRGPKPANEVVIIQSTDPTVDDASFRTFAENVVADLRAQPEAVKDAVSFYEVQAPGLVSEDRQTLIIPVTLTGDYGDASETVKPVLDIVDEANGHDGFLVLTGGDGSLANAMNEGSAHDAETGERIGIPVALIILLLVFGAAVAAGIPVIMALVSIVVAFGVSVIIGQGYELSILLTSIVPMIGLAVGIDYSLLIVQRFREERSRGLEKLDAIEMAGATASRTVAFSGGTVVVGLLGMMIVPSNVYRSIAIGTSVVTAVAVVCALTLLPAVLSLLGDKVNALRIPFIKGVVATQDGDTNSGFWGRVASIVMGHPWISVIGSTALLLALASPALSLNLGISGVSTLPEKYEVRHAFEILQQKFSAGQAQPVEIVVDAADVNASDVQAGLTRLQETLSSDTEAQYGEGQIQKNDAGNLLLLSVPMNLDPDSDGAHAAIKRLRSEQIPAAFEGVNARVLVTGNTAGQEDFYDVIKTYAPFVFLFVLGLSFLLLMLVFRSIVVPAKALVMNLLSVAAAYGMLVLVFQKGVGHNILGLQHTENIEVWLPLFLFSVLFGLSMDYHVFLLSRIREHYDETHDNKESVAFGLKATAGMITGAALIMVVVFSGFALGDLVSLQQVGFGLAVAVILDATIIRCVLVPASMELLGDWNWYLPSWLRWLPKVHFEPPGQAAPQQPRAYPATGGGGS